MSSYITKCYRYLVPKALRKKIYKYFLKSALDKVRPILFIIKTKVWHFISTFCTLKNEKHQIWSFMGKYGSTHYPYDYYLKYMNLKISIFIDPENQLPYVLHYNKRLYFSRNMDNALIAETYKSLLAEQDEQSAHRYVDSYERFNGKFILDIGAAEGIISLEVIERVKFVYLFECSPDWIEALEATFAPYQNKIKIINKYVSDDDNTNCITLDTFFKDKPFDDLFIKMDIERAELRALHGANFVLRNAKNLDFSVCIYHNPEDEITIPDFLKSCGYECVMSPGFLFIGDWWLRKGMVRRLIK